MPDEMYVVCLENDCCEDITRTLRRCRLLNKMKGMKPTRELHIRRRSQTGARKRLAGPTPEKDNEANPAQHCYNTHTCKHTHRQTHTDTHRHTHIGKHTGTYTDTHTEANTW